MPGFDLPPLTRNESGEIRKAGFEIEFGAKDCTAAAQIIADLYGGRLERINPHYFKAHDTRLGTFVVELDTRIVPSEPIHDPEGTPEYEDEIDRFLSKEVPEYFYELLGDISKKVVPYEVVTPPIPLDQLHELNRLMAGLSQLGARGTDEEFWYAFGLHINPEAPSLEAENILSVLRAFLLLSDCLHETMDIDWTRQLSPYINTFPREYAMKVLDPAYAPDMPRLIDDYLADNPTRNRELDLLPLLMSIDERRVAAGLDGDDLTSARPTFHLRLPDCRLNDPDWSLAGQWNLWVQVERLAADSRALATLGPAYIEHFDALIPGNWAEKVRRHLEL